MSSVPVGHAVVGGEPLPRDANTISCRAKAFRTALVATVWGEAARDLLERCLRAGGPGVAGGLAAGSRPRLPYSGVSLVPAPASGLVPSRGLGRLLCVSVRAGP